MSKKISVSEAQDKILHVLRSIKSDEIGELYEGDDSEINRFITDLLEERSIIRDRAKPMGVYGLTSQGEMLLSELTLREFPTQEEQENPIPIASSKVEVANLLSSLASSLISAIG